MSCQEILKQLKYGARKSTKDEHVSIGPNWWMRWLKCIITHLRLNVWGQLET